ncbi:MAG: hypothetical protein RIQ77_318 [Pseudomonadota bacterium]
MAEAAAAAAAAVKTALGGAYYVPTKFAGKGDISATAHWLSFLDYLDFEGIQQNENYVAEVTKRFKTTLTGQARQWFEESGKNALSLDDLQNRFKARFGVATSRMDSYMAFHGIKMRPNEALSDYRHRIEAAASKAKITDNEVILHVFCAGFPDPYRTTIMSRRDNSLEEAFKTAQIVMSPSQQANQPNPVMLSCQVESPTPPAQPQLEKSLAPICDKLEDLVLSFDKLSLKDRITDRQSDSRKRSTSRSRREHPNRSRSRERFRSRTPSYRGRSNDRNYDRNRSFSRERSLSRNGRNFNRASSKSPRRYKSPAPPDRKITFADDVCTFCNKRGHLWRQCYKVAKLVQDTADKRQGQHF